MTDRKSLVRSVRSLADQLRVAARWEGSGSDVDALANAYVFEFLCYLHVLQAAAGHYRFEIQLRDRRDFRRHSRVAIFPKSPAKKVNFSYAKLFGADGQQLFDLNAGIEIIDPYGTSRSPDVSLTRPTADSDPVSQDVFMFWDAKFRLDVSQKLSRPEVHNFIVTYEVLGSPQPPAIWTQKVSSPAFSATGLLTNGLHSDETAAFLKQRGICETSLFPASPQSRP